MRAGRLTDVSAYPRRRRVCDNDLSEAGCRPVGLYPAAQRRAAMPEDECTAAELAAELDRLDQELAAVVAELTIALLAAAPWAEYRETLAAAKDAPGGTGRRLGTSERR